MRVVRDTRARVESPPCGDQLAMRGSVVTALLSTEPGLGREGVLKPKCSRRGHARADMPAPYPPRAFLALPAPAFVTALDP